jgi:hypothetical protein
MKARIVLSYLLLLLVVVGILLGFAVNSKQAHLQPSGPTQVNGANDTRLQAADGDLIWESVSRHLLSAVQ